MARWKYDLSRYNIELRKVKKYKLYQGITDVYVERLAQPFGSWPIFEFLEFMTGQKKHKMANTVL